MDGVAAEIYARFRASAIAARAAALCADENAIQQAVTQLAFDGLDERSVALLRRAPRLVLGTATALEAVVTLHRGRVDEYGAITCHECRTSAGTPCRTVRRVAECLSATSHESLVDTAEAWRRANAYLGADQRAGHLLIAMAEFNDGYVARPVRLALPEPPSVPNPNSDRVLIIDKRTGEITTWPLMPLAATAVMYGRYKRGEAMVFNDSTRG